jgi:hypothetical protein
MHHGCPECTRLWSEYALATRHYLKLEGRLQIAHMSRDQQSVEQLSPLVLSAAEERAEIRRQIDGHEAHSQVNKATA